MKAHLAVIALLSALFLSGCNPDKFVFCLNESYTTDGDGSQTEQNDDA